MVPPRMKSPKLQWGRGLLTPEICVDGDVFVALVWLQWGRGLLTPEISRARQLVVVGVDASMGPGSFDPGNENRPANPYQGQRRFNGAGVF